MAQKQLYMTIRTRYCIKKSCCSFNHCLSAFIDVATRHGVRSGMRVTLKEDLKNLELFNAKRVSKQSTEE